MVSEPETEPDGDTAEEEDEEQIQTTTYEVKAKPTRVPQQTLSWVSSIPPMIVRPSITQTASAYVKVLG